MSAKRVDLGTPIKPPQSKRGKGSSTVSLVDGAPWNLPGCLVYVKQQHGYYCRPFWAGLRAVPTFRREYRALTALSRAGIRVPDVLSYTEQAGDARLVLREVPDALDLRRALLESGKSRCVILAKVAKAIAALHRSGWVHCALYPDHILYSRQDEKIYLIDFEKARRNPLRREADLERLWRRFDGFCQRERDHFDQIYRAELKLQHPEKRVVRAG